MIGDPADHERPGRSDLRGLHAGATYAVFRRQEVVITGVAESSPGPSLLDLLTLEEIDTDLYRTSTLNPDPFGLFGGQVAAQTLRAAGHTVEPDRVVHSMHGYFLRPGDPERPVVFEVHRDRDGRSYSARRVVARQGGKVIFNLAASFHVPEDGPDLQAGAMPAEPLPGPDTPRLRSGTIGVDFFEATSQVSREPWWEPPVAGAGRLEDARPSRVWARPQLLLPHDEPHLHACVLTYLSDILTGLSTLTAPGPDTLLTSLDHAVWFHRPVDLNDWVLMDLTGQSIAAGRGMYSGRIFARDGRLVAGLTQESLFRKDPARSGRPRRVVRE
ncbi:acyl-CoA thioesterase [Kineosporia succinea]|uniref:Acyl-CoA thioesterase-2 n=1 Tax=Kineosporia succinea TaxID=84632 RepID=A0ABT9P408_9ACTN|nr:acyl-CoA thioesterase domain-containing protein [Kineosporia succinea]MDP9827419.1 acyl-CoA thioesterase-2 [Kineosporia succinea]